MSDPTFPNLLRGNRISGQLRMVMAEGFSYKFPTDYTYAEVPLQFASGAEGVFSEKIQRNQQAELVAPCTLRPQLGYKGLVILNPVVFQYAMAPSMLMFDASTAPQQVSIPAKFHRDMPLSALEWLCRVYLIS